MMWLVGLFIVAIAFGGLAHLLPPKSERVRNRIKELALSHGFQLYSRKVPCGSVEGRVQGDSYLRTFYARKQQPEWDLPEFMVFRTTGASGNYLPDGWDWGGEQYHRQLGEQLLPLLQQLGPRFDALAFDRQRGLALRWREELSHNHIDGLVAATEVLLSMPWPIVFVDKETPG